jgi:uncharacterized protein
MSLEGISAGHSIRSLQSAWHDELKSGLLRIVEKLKLYGPKQIILFGSMITGSISAQSDLDILVIMPSEKTGKEWMKMIGEVIVRPVPVDLLIFNEDEITEFSRKSSFLQHILHHGQVVYDFRSDI